ncbi:hypothetical protein H4582DRAFT_2059567 [Lactarius indigo]|nr:hypothetical protein H4582DRAFT_2059567 [Lactarius indigo]
MSFTPGPMTELLHSQLGDGCFSDTGSTNYHTREAPRSLDTGSTGYHTREAPRSLDSYMLARDPHTQSYHHPPTSLWSPYPGPKDTDTPPREASHGRHSVNASGSFHMRSQEKNRILSQATHEDLFGAQNPVYMHLYTENIKLTASLETLEKAIQGIASRAPNPPAANIDEIDEPPSDMDPADFPAINYWFKHQQRAEFNRRKEFSSNGSVRRGPAATGENRQFWFLEYEDGTMLDGHEVANIRAYSQEIWASMCNKYRPIGQPWGKVKPWRHREYWRRVEAKYPILRLCDSHYKANSIPTIDYTHWYQMRYPNNETPTDSVRKRSHTASPAVARKSRRIGRSSGPRSRRQIVDDDEEEEDFNFDEEEDVDEIIDDPTPSVSSPSRPPVRPKARAVARRTRSTSATSPSTSRPNTRSGTRRTHGASPMSPSTSRSNARSGTRHTRGASPMSPSTSRSNARSGTRHTRGASPTSPSTSRPTLDSPISTIAPSTQPAPPIVPTATDGGNTPTVHEDQGPTTSGAPEGLLGPSNTQHATATTGGPDTEVSIIIPNPLADIVRKTPAPTTPPVPPSEDANIQTQEGPAPRPDSAGTNNDAQMMDAMASTPDQAPEGAPSTATNGVPAKPGPERESTNTTDDAPTTATDTVTSAPTPGAASSGDASEATSKTNKSASKTKTKKAGIMRPGKSTTARNLYAIDFLKDHQVTCDEFAKIWNELDEDTCMTYTRRELEGTKKKTAGSTPA